MVPVLPKGELEVLLEAAIDLSKKGQMSQVMNAYQIRVGCRVQLESLGVLRFVVMFRARREVRGVSEVFPRRSDDLVHQNPDGRGRERLEV